VTKRTGLLSAFSAAAGISFLLLALSAAREFPAAAYAASAAKRPAQSLAKVFARPIGGDVSPCRWITDAYPEFNNLKIDSKAGLVVISDTNLKSLLVYQRDAQPEDGVTPFQAQIKGPATYLSFATGVALDPVEHRIYVAENDVGDDVASFPYDADGDYKARVLAVPHGSYGVALSRKRGEMAVSVEHDAAIVIYRLGATGAEHPLRQIRGMHTQMADPHGLYWDDQNGEIAVVNHGNWARGYWDVDYNGGGRYQPPSITVFAAKAGGDSKPLRVIQGSKTEFDWPSDIALDSIHNEIAVANTAGHSVLIFDRQAKGNVAPLRKLAGPATGITVPMGVAFDTAHDELWVTNFGHEALIFDRTAQGDVAPKRILRNAPAGTAVSGFGNPYAIAYDSKRGQLLVPN
jgi:DNA-binding beta-propeller fold protein YncE